MENFWNAMTKVTGPIPASVRIALEVTKYVHGGLAYLDDKTIDTIETDVRKFPAVLGKSEMDVQQMLGGYKGNLREFRFMAGERSAFMMVAASVQKHGIQKFWKTTKNSDSNVPDRVDAKRSVQTKIISYYAKRKSHDESEEDFMEKLDELKIDINYDQHGAMASVACPYCEPNSKSTVTIRPEKSGNWKISNFSSHVKSKHNNLNFPGRNLTAEDKPRRAEKRQGEQQCGTDQLVTEDREMVTEDRDGSDREVKHEEEDIDALAPDQAESETSYEIEYLERLEEEQHEDQHLN